MTVKAILDRKGSEVATIEPTADLASAVKLLAARRIGALVVTCSEERSLASSPSETSSGCLPSPAPRLWNSRWDK